MACNFNSFGMDPDSGSDDSDNEDKVERRDSAAMLDTWLAELDSLTVEIAPHQVGPLRFSRATLEDTQEDELNAILGELSALQINLDREIKPSENIRFSVADGGNKNGQTPSENGARTDSPDNDSGFSDNASLLSSGSSLSASGSSSGSSTTSSNLKNCPVSPTLPSNEDEKRSKIREALEKMRAASVTRLYVKAFSADGSSKALMVEESMSCGRVLALLADKNHVSLTSKWSLVEHLPHLQMERILEDHENMVDVLMLWTRDSKNKILFVIRDEKYDVFNNPQRYLDNRHRGSSSSTSTALDTNCLIEEFFNQGGWVPEVESQLFLKAEGKKAWKKFPFVLRASGVYYSPKGKVSGNSSKDLVCLASIDINVEAYQGVGWKKKFKAPTEFGFALKPSRLQVKAPRYIKYLCAEDQETLSQWMVGLRLAKHGKQMLNNYKSLHEELIQDDFDHFGTSLEVKPIRVSTQLIRAENIVNMGYATESAAIRNQIPIRKLSRTDDFNTTSIVTHPGGREEGFESDAPFGGTIKRKPSTVLNPKIPLTFNTRSLVSEYITKVEGNPITLSHTLQRKRSVSGNSASGNSASNSSCQGSIVSIGMNPSINAPVGPIQAVSRGDDSFDSLELEYENLPPPPPELLVGDCESYCQSELQHNSTISISTKPSFSNENNKYPGCLPRNIESDSAVNYKDSHPKNVSFANELSQRLKNRPNNASDSLHFTKNTHNNANPSGVSVPLVEPTPDFLIDLKRVMEKKWQIAQKCRVDGKETAHEILGFRIEQGSADRHSQGEENSNSTPNSLNNVRAWVSQHYGNSLDGYSPLPNSTYNPKIIQQQSDYSIPIVPKINPQLPFFNQVSSQNSNSIYSHSRPQRPQHQSVVIYENIQDRNSSNSGHFPIQNVQVRNKKPPPPIPKRADSTHLSAHFVYN